MDKEIFGTCPVCGKNIIENKACYYCEDKECDFKIFKNVCGITLNKDDITDLLARKETKVYDMISSKGNAFKAKLKLKRDNTGLEFIFDKAEPTIVGKCPKCNSDVVTKSGIYGQFYKCSNDTCNFKVNGIIAGTTITPDIVKKLLEDKKTSKIEFTSKKNTKFKASILLENNGDIKFDFENDK